MNILRITAKANPEKELELKQAIKSALEKASKFEEIKKCFSNYKHFGHQFYYDNQLCILTSKSESYQTKAS